MSPELSVFSGLFLVVTLFSFFVAFLAWEKKSVKGARDIALLMVATGVSAFFLIFEAAATSLAEKVFWAKWMYSTAVTLPVIYLIFVLRFTGNERLLKTRNILVLLVLPVLTFLVALTNDRHHLLWSGFSAISEKTNLMEYYHGIWFWIGYTGYSYLIMLVASVYVFRFIMRHTYAFRAQGWVIFAGSLFPWTASIVYITGISPVPGLDLVPVGMMLSGALFVYAILYFRFLDLVPIARKTLVETLSDGILVLDDQNRIQDINQAALAFLGIPDKNIIGTQAGLSGATVTRLMNAVIDQNSWNEQEICESKATRTFRVMKQQIKNQPGSQLVLIRDISDQVARQNEIKKGEERYRNMYAMFRLMADNMPDMLWAKDLDSRFIFANKAVCENLLNTTDVDEPIGKTHLFFARREMLRYPEKTNWYTFGDQGQESDRQVISTEKVGHFDEYGNINGRFLFLDVWKAPIFDENDVLIGVVGSGRDVTLQKKAEEDIYKRDLLLNAISRAIAVLVQGESLEHSINGALEIIGKATAVNRVYIFQNHESPGYKMPLMSQRYEWSDGSVEPQINNPDLQGVAYETACPRWFERLKSGQVIVGNVRDFPDIERRELESQGIVSILVTPVFIDNAFWGFIGFDDCINERDWPATEEQILNAAANTIGAAYLRKKNQDELLAAKEKAEESDRLKSAFLANMSHEIRTPMNGILGFAELLKEPDLTGDEQQQYIGIIEKSGIRMLKIINDLVDLSKLESGQMEVNLSDTNVNEQIDYIYNFFKPEADQKGLTLSGTAGLNSTDAIIVTDREKVYAILTNLVKNAIKFTHKGSVEFGYFKKDGYLEYFVKDTGPGVSRESQQSIFDRFVQANNSSKQILEGAGLGLSIAKAYAEMLGGRIWLVSEPGLGSSFCFTIPYNQPQT